MLPLSPTQLLSRTVASPGLTGHPDASQSWPLTTLVFKRTVGSHDGDAAGSPSLGCGGTGLGSAQRRWWRGSLGHRDLVSPSGLGLQATVPPSTTFTPAAPPKGVRTHMPTSKWPDTSPPPARAKASWCVWLTIGHSGRQRCGWVDRGVGGLCAYQGMTDSPAQAAGNRKFPAPFEYRWKCWALALHRTLPPSLPQSVALLAASSEAGASHQAWLCFHSCFSYGRARSPGIQGPTRSRRRGSWEGCVSPQGAPLGFVLLVPRAQG